MKQERPVRYHLNLSERIAIEMGLRQGKNFKQIGKELGRDATTISKEVKRVIADMRYDNEPVDCIRVKECRRTNLCSKQGCHNFCKYCKDKDCSKICRMWGPARCQKLMAPPYVCNGCNALRTCHKGKQMYRAQDAQKLYEKTRSESRKGINASEEDLKRINALVSPLILQHQSFAHIYATHGEELGISRSTLYNYIAMGLLDAKTMDLPRKVRYKRRKKKTSVKPRNTDYKYRFGRTYRDFEQYTAEHPELDIIEMDTVHGKAEKGACLLTLLFRSSSLMLIYLLPSCTSKSVVRVLNEITDKIGAASFQKTFPVILTDNGPEFKDAEGMEKDRDGKRRTRIFFCDPQQSNQKSRLERNHEFIRYVLPKGHSFYWLTPELVLRLMTHINSLKRDSLNMHSPYEVAQLFLDKKVLDSLRITCVPADQVQLNPALLT